MRLLVDLAPSVGGLVLSRLAPRAIKGQHRRPAGCPCRGRGQNRYALTERGTLPHAARRRAYPACRSESIEHRPPPHIAEICCERCTTLRPVVDIPKGLR